MTTDIERDIACHAAGTRAQNLGTAARAAAVRGIVDTVGCMLAATRAPGIDVLVELAQGWGGRDEASVIGHGFGCPAPLASWINGAMARALEIDDCTDFLPLHPSAALVPPLLALAEARPALRGEDLVTALAVGQDLILRLASATRVDGITSGRYNLFKVFGVAAALARLAGLDAQRTQHALGIAYGFACGEGQSAMDGSLAFRLQDGNASQAGLTAMLMAERGFTGPREFLTGRMGFFTSFEPQPLLERLTEDLGRRFRGAEISVKPYSACRCTHTAIGLALGQRALMPALADALERAVVRVAPSVHKLVGAPVGADDATLPQAAAQFSLSYTVAAALRCGEVFLPQFTPQALARADVLALARRIEAFPDEAMQDPRFVTGRTRLELHLRDGTMLTLEGVEPPGNPANPASPETIRRKFLQCAVSDDSAPHVLPRVESLLAALLDIECAPDAGALARRLR
ncbi:MAG: MmgE/PrpD family protein [Burkholderiaceae bacterium]|nr:MmgE/PrpD family protein [Burkholderiaceae bacterium]